MKNTILLFKTPGCANCERAIDLLKKIIKDYPKVNLKEVNVLDKPSEAVKYGIMSSPALVINGKLEFVGVPSEKKLRSKLEELK